MDDMNCTITLTLSPEEARLVLRAVKARAKYWSRPEQVKRISNSGQIRAIYRGAAGSLEHQMVSQGINP